MMSTSPNKSLSKNASINHLPSTLVPASPQSTRTLRRLHSAQNLSSNAPSLIAQQRQLQQSQLQGRTGIGQIKEAASTLQNHPNHIAPGPSSLELPSRLRANSDLAASHTVGNMYGHRRPGPLRKGPSSDSSGKRS